MLKILVSGAVPPSNRKAIDVTCLWFLHMITVRWRSRSVVFVWKEALKEMNSAEWETDGKFVCIAPPKNLRLPSQPCMLFLFYFFNVVWYWSKYRVCKLIVSLRCNLVLARTLPTSALLLTFTFKALSIVLKLLRKWWQRLRIYTSIWLHTYHAYDM